MQPTYPSLNNPNRLIHPGVSDNMSRPPRMIDPRLASYHVNRFNPRLRHFQTEPQFSQIIPQTAMVSPILRPPAMNHVNHSVYSNVDVRSQSQNLSISAQHNANLDDDQWNNDVHQFNLNLAQSWPSKIQEKFDKLANRFRDMIEDHKKLARKHHRSQINENNEEEVCACLPPIETFTGVSKAARKSHFYQYLEKGDLLCVKILDHSEGGFICVVVCMDGGKRRNVHDCDIKVFCPSSNCQPLAVTDSEFQDGYQINDIVRVSVVSYNKFDCRVIVSMKEEHLSKELRGKFKMGLINDDELPIHYRRQFSMKSMNYDEMLRKTLSFNNPGATSYLAGFFELPTIQRLSFLKDFHGVTYPNDECAKHLRKFQSTVMARQSVEEGVKFLKSGCYVEAQQCLNKALQIDSDNLDALVARGCLYANTNNLMKAAEDFDKALSINPEHVNARKYMAETLFELGKICEEKGDLDSAAKNYRRVCQIDTKNHEALEALKSVIEKKGIQRSRSPHNDLKSMLQDIKDKSYYESSHQLKTLLEEDKKRKKKSSRRRSSSSSSSSSSSDTSSSSSSSSSSPSSDSDSSASLSSRRKSRRRKKSRKSKSKKSKRKKNKKRRSRSIKPLPGIKISKSKDSEKPVVNSEPSTSRTHSKKISPKISFTFKKNESEIKTLKSAKPFASSSKAGSPKRNPVTEKIVYNLDKLKPVSIEFVRNGLLNEKFNESKVRKTSPRRAQNQGRMYIPGRSRSRSRSPTRRRRSRSRSRSRSRAICRAVRSPRRQSRVRDDPFRDRPPIRSNSKERSSSSRSKSKSSPKDALKKAAEEAKKVEAVITNQNSGQKKIQ